MYDLKCAVSKVKTINANPMLIKLKLNALLHRITKLELCFSFENLITRSNIPNRIVKIRVYATYGRFLTYTSVKQKPMSPVKKIGR